MNEVLGSLKSELLRPLATLILPGGIAVTPYFILLRVMFGPFSKLVTDNPTQTLALATAAALFVGLVLEDAGSGIESKWDKPIHKDTWNEYLRLAFKVEPIGQKYIRSLVLRLKFELGSFVALCVAGPGVVALFFYHTGRFCLTPTIPMATVFVLVGLVWLSLLVFLHRWADSGHDLLHDARVELLKGITVVSDGHAGAGSSQSKEGH